jgi:hypothetical protein
VEEEKDSHLLMKYPETEKWRKELLKSEWMCINEEIAVRKALTRKAPLNRAIEVPSYKR